MLSLTCSGMYSGVDIQKAVVCCLYEYGKDRGENKGKVKRDTSVSQNTSSPITIEASEIPSQDGFHHSLVLKSIPSYFPKTYDLILI